MDPTLVPVVREAVLLALLVSGPPLAAALVVGLVVGVLQAATQVQDPAIPVVPRLVAVFVALGASGPWIGARVVRFATACFEAAARVAP
jgi:type III secretory pathway component EscS